MKHSHSNPFVPPRYGLLRHDRILHRGMGVALVFREDFTMLVVHLSTEKIFVIPQESKADYIAVNALHARFFFNFIEISNKF